jgi:excisionase family DNA binding protein
MDDELITTGEAAKYLDMSRQRMIELAEGGKIPTRRAGKFWLFRKTDLDRWKAAPKDKGGRPKSDVKIPMEYQTPSSVAP